MMLCALAEPERASRFNYMARSRRQVRPAARRLHIDCAPFAKKRLRLGNTLGVCMFGFKTHRQFQMKSELLLEAENFWFSQNRF
jgi:hypothetical protein